MATKPLSIFSFFANSGFLDLGFKTSDFKIICANKILLFIPVSQRMTLASFVDKPKIHPSPKRAWVNPIIILRVGSYQKIVNKVN